MTPEQVDHLLRTFDYVAGSLASATIVYVISTWVRIAQGNRK